MSNNYFYTLPLHSLVTGYEYNKNSDLEAVGYFALANEKTIQTVPEATRELVYKIINIDRGDVILEYDLDQVTNNQLGTPAIFKSIVNFSKFNDTLATMWQISGLTPHTLPKLPAGTLYSHIGCFINRPNSGIRLNVGGGGHYIKQFILDNGGDAYWFDYYEKHNATYTAVCDFINGEIHNIRLEIHRGIALKEIEELRNNVWVQGALSHSQQAIQANYNDNTPNLIISHYKVGANTKDISNGYMKMYTEAQWAKST
jgi:hypothetical protein